MSSAPKTAIVTGGANGIGAATIRKYFASGHNIVIADLPSSQSSAEALLSSLESPERTLFHPTNITDWSSMQSLFRATKNKFGSVDVVVANAGLMESTPFFEFDEDSNGDLKENTESTRVLDVNLKGTMNTLRLALWAMKCNTASESGYRGSVILVASTSGYFGGTGVVSYISSKHGVVGLARASQRDAAKLGVRVNVIAPFFTPTHITGGYAEAWVARGLPANTVDGVASAIVELSLDESQGSGKSVMVAGAMNREIEERYKGLTGEWLGEEIAGVMREGGKFFDDMGGYTLPKARS